MHKETNDYGKRFMKVTPWYGDDSEPQRMVNQEEIVNYYTTNPGRTESQMQLDVYDYVRSHSRESNKKYADCLRRALYSRKLSRILAQTPRGKRYIYFVI